MNVMQPHCIKLHVKKAHFLLIVLISGSITFLSCQEDNTVGNRFPEIADIATVHGNGEGKIVVVNTQGGPLTTLAGETLNEFIAQTQTQSALYVNVHQAQTKNPGQFQHTDITFEEAKQFDMQSVSNLKKVVDFFKKQPDKTVYVLGISFGAFVTQELIATHGIDVADGYLIMVGRLNIDEGTWKPFSEGKRTVYIYDADGHFTIEPEESEEASFEDKNMAKLAAGLGHNRYVSKLASVADLSKITYVYGDRDEQVGPLTPQEIQFLKDKGATVVVIERANHNTAINGGLRRLKQTFRIP